MVLILPEAITILRNLCEHNYDGAEHVANYIVEEIKRNVKSDAANSIRYCLDYDGRIKEWNDKNIFLSKKKKVYFMIKPEFHSLKDLRNMNNDVNNICRALQDILNNSNADTT